MLVKIQHTCLGTEDGHIVRKYIKGYIYRTSGRLGRILIMREYAELYNKRI